MNQKKKKIYNLIFPTSFLLIFPTFSAKLAGEPRGVPAAGRAHAAPPPPQPGSRPPLGARRFVLLRFLTRRLESPAMKFISCHRRLFHPSDETKQQRNPLAEAGGEKEGRGGGGALVGRDGGCSPTPTTHTHNPAPRGPQWGKNHKKKGKGPRSGTSLPLTKPRRPAGLGVPPAPSLPSLAVPPSAPHAGATRSVL